MPLTNASTGPPPPPSPSPALAAAAAAATAALATAATAATAAALAAAVVAATETAALAAAAEAMVAAAAVAAAALIDLTLRAAAAALDPRMLACALHAGADPATASNLDCTALMLACMRGGDDAATLAIVETLLATGRSCVGHRAQRTGITALMLASQLGMHTVVRALLEAGADLQIIDAEGETAWCKASNNRGSCSSMDRASAYSDYSATLTVLEEAATFKAEAAAALATSWSQLQARIESRRPSSPSSLEDAPPVAAPSAQETREGLAQLAHGFELSAAQVRSFDECRYLRIPGLLPPAVLAEARARIVALASRATGGRDASVPKSPLAQPPAGASAAAVDAWWSSVSEPAVRSWHMQMM